MPFTNGHWFAVARDGRAPWTELFDAMGTQPQLFATDPYTALVEADAWYKANIEKAADE
jgi:hypothetical protein